MIARRFGKTPALLSLLSLLSVSTGCVSSHTPASASPETALVGTMRDGRHISLIEPDTFYKSERIDFVQVDSSITGGVKIAAAIYKPENPGPILLMSHGWHESVTRPAPDAPSPYPGFLVVQVDMRGRAYSSGEPDANGLELYDFLDALTYARKEYAEFISDPGEVHFVGGSGGGGNALAIAGRFPDLFASVVALYGMSDYAAWYRNDKVGEFRDEMDIWIGMSPDENDEAYAARSGVTALPNLLSPLYIAHGETDLRVPSSHSRNYAAAAALLHKPVVYKELKGVGNNAHLGNITPDQQEELDAFVDEALRAHHQAPALPESGLLVVPGYVRTRYFEVMLDSVDHVGLVAYDLKKRQAALIKGSGTILFY
jgi:dipeptidyl aminopeptidase/acylaminoacyl peptidase